MSRVEHIGDVLPKHQGEKLKIIKQFFKLLKGLVDSKRAVSKAAVNRRNCAW